MENFRTGVATALHFERNFLDCILRCLETGSIAFKVVLKAKDGTEIALKEMPADNRFENNPFGEFRVSVFAGIHLTKGGSGWEGEFGLIAPVFGAEGSVTHDAQNFFIRIDHPGKTMQTFKVPLGRFQAEELQDFGDLEIRTGHMGKAGFEEYTP